MKWSDPRPARHSVAGDVVWVVLIVVASLWLLAGGR